MGPGWDDEAYEDLPFDDKTRVMGSIETSTSIVLEARGKRDFFEPACMFFGLLGLAEERYSSKSIIHWSCHEGVARKCVLDNEMRGIYRPKLPFRLDNPDPEV